MAFSLGLIAGLTFCPIFALPILLPYLLAEGKGIKEALKLTFLFAGAKLGSYAVFASVGFVVGKAIEQAYPAWSKYGMAALGGIAILVGALVVLEEMRKVSVPSPEGTCAGLGFGTGMVPCPLVVALVVGISATSSSFFEVVASLLAFWAGTVVVLFPLGAICGAIRKFVGDSLKPVGGFALIFFGSLLLLLAFSR